MLVDLAEDAGGVAGQLPRDMVGPGRCPDHRPAWAARGGAARPRSGSAPARPRLVELQVANIDPDDPIRNIAVVHQDHVAAHDAGQIFNPDWLARVEGMAVFRFMEWVNANYTTLSDWADRPVPEDYTYTPDGVPLEVMIRLANETGTEPWFTIPHLASDDFIAQMAGMIRDQLDPGLRAWIEFSNETWNWSFPQANHARDQAQARWGDGDRWQEWNAMRAAQMVQIFNREFDGQARPAGAGSGHANRLARAGNQLLRAKLAGRGTANPAPPTCSMPMPSPAISARFWAMTKRWR